MNAKNSNPAKPKPATRHVRLVMPDHLYKEVRHRLVEAGPETSISELIVELITVGLTTMEGGRE